jgi:hypothetical protein
MSGDAATTIPTLPLLHDSLEVLSRGKVYSNLFRAHREHAQEWIQAILIYLDLRPPSPVLDREKNALIAS